MAPEGDRDLTETYRMTWSQPGEERAKNALNTEHSITWKAALCVRSVSSDKEVVREDAL